MTRQLVLIVLFLLGGAAAGAGRGGDGKDKGDPEKGLEVKIGDLEDFVAKTKLLTVNNLALKETAHEDFKGLVHFEFKASVKNRTDKEVNFILMVVGLSSDKKILWSIAPRHSVAANDQLVQEDTVILPEGTKKATQYLWLRVVNR